MHPGTAVGPHGREIPQARPVLMDQGLDRGRQAGLRGDELRPGRHAIMLSNICSRSVPKPLTGDDRREARPYPPRMLLSDRDLVSEIKQGQLQLDPFEPALVQPSSIDVRL